MSYQALLFCPDEKTARVVTQVLTELDFTVEPCNETFAAVKKLMAQHFDAIVVDCDNEQNAALLFKSARNSAPNQSSLSVAVVEGQAGVAKAFRIGANLVLTKPINVEQSKGTLRVARGLLRKADASKPAASNSPAPQAIPSSPASFEAVRPPTSPTFSERPDKVITPLPSVAAIQAPGTAEVTAAGFEVEEEELPQPEPAEVALLESIPDPIAKQSATFAKKELPWQPVSTPAPKSTDSVLQAGIQSPSAPAKPSQPLSFGESKKTKDALSGTPVGLGSAAAPAPAKETSHTASKPTEAKISKTNVEVEAIAATIPTTAPQVEPPMFSALAVKDHEASSETSSKKPFLFVVAAVLLIAAGYVGWTRMHKVNQGTTVQVPAAQAPASVTQPASAVATTENAKPTPSAQEPAQAIAADTTRSPQVGTTIASSSKPTPATRIAADETTHPGDASVASPESSAPQPIVVKKAASQPSAPKPVVAEAAQPSAPPALAVGGNPDADAIAGIMSSAPTRVPKPTAQTVKISQGVSQGLLVKRVQPVYPPQAMQMRMQGAVLLDATIGKDGSITKVKRVTGDSVLAKAAMDAVKQWKYKPYYLNGEPVEIDTEITVNFKLP